MRGAVPTVVIDTREQRPILLGPPFRCVRGALGEGDYAVRGLGVRVERKSLPDLYSTLTVRANLARFRRELARLGKYPHRYLLIEGSPKGILSGSRYSAANPFLVLRHALRLCLEFGLQPLFSDGPRDAGKLLEALFLELLEARRRPLRKLRPPPVFTLGGRFSASEKHRNMSESLPKEERRDISSRLGGGGDA